MTALCRDSGALASSANPCERCAVCGSPCQVDHGSFHTLSITGVECEAFCVAVEKHGTRRNAVNSWV
jgi:hypothetical protein